MQAFLCRIHIFDLNVQRLCLAACEFILLKQHIVQFVILFAHGDLTLIQTHDLRRKFFPFLAFISFQRAQFGRTLIQIVSAFDQLGNLIGGTAGSFTQSLRLLFDLLDLRFQHIAFFPDGSDLFFYLAHTIRLCGFSGLQFFNGKACRLRILGKRNQFQIDLLRRFAQFLAFFLYALRVSGYTGDLAFRFTDLCLHLVCAPLRGFAFFFKLRDPCAGIVFLRLKHRQPVAEGFQFFTDALFLALGADQIFFGCHQIRLRSLHTCGGMVCILKRCLIFGGKLLLLRLQFFCLGKQIFYHICAGKDTCPFRAAAARHGAAGIDDLPVQRNDLKPVFVFLCNADGTVHIIRDHNARQQIADDLLIVCITIHKIACNGNKTKVICQVFFIQRSALYVGDRQKCGSAEVIGFQIIDCPLGVCLR
ncbi:unknown [Clostridium sp. CAG:678]|nr:unknown [Clostridium sp. CAG:678]